MWKVAVGVALLVTAPLWLPEAAVAAAVGSAGVLIAAGAQEEWI